MSLIPSVDGGYLFPVSPDLSAIDTPVFWLPELDTGAVTLSATSPVFPGKNDLSGLLTSREVRMNEGGEYFRYHLGRGRYMNLVRLTDADFGKSLSISIPVDPDGLDRIDAAERLLRSLLRRRVPPDKRMTPQQRRRSRFMLQAVDGRMSGASYREIATVIYGMDRVADDPWKSSPLRDAVMDLVRDGFIMIEGGYLALLRQRRRK